MKNKFIFRIAGGLGNQMYEYAFAWALCRKYNAEMVLDVSNYYEGAFRDLGLGFFEIDTYKEIKFKMKPGIVNKIYRRLGIGLNTKVCREFQHNPYKMAKRGGKIYFLGVWGDKLAHLKYYESEIRNQFQINIELGENARSVLKRIQEDKKLVVTHVRRGDYVTVNRSTMAMDYYDSAMESMKRKLGRDCTFLFFCEDIKWVKNWYKDRNDCLFQELAMSDIEEFYLMSECKNIITADSTFSWWAAWLNDVEHNKNVITPRRENPNIIPDWWETIMAKSVNVDEDIRYQ